MSASVGSEGGHVTGRKSSLVGGEGGHVTGRKSSLLPDTLSMKVASEITVIGGLSLTNVIDFGEEECLVARLSHDKSLWAVGLTNGKVQLYTSETCVLAYSLDPPDRREKQTVTGIAFVPSDSPSPEQKHLLLVSYATGQVRLWHYTGVSKAPLWSLEEPRVATDGSEEGGEPNQILCLSCSGDGHRFATGGVDTCIRVYDTRRHTLLTLCQSSQSATRVDGHRNRVCALVYHPLGRQYPAEFGHIFLSGGWDNTVQIWDDRHRHSLWAYFGPHVCGTDAIDVDPLQNHILTGSWERHKAMLQVWKFNEDTLDGPMELDDRAAQAMLRAKPLGELLQGPQVSTPSMGYVAQWLGEQYMVYGGSNANVLKVVDRGTLNVIGSVTDLPKGVYSVASLQPEPDSRRPYKLAACAGNRLYVLRFDRK